MSAASIRIATVNDAERMAQIQLAAWLVTYPNRQAGITQEDIRQNSWVSRGADRTWRRIISRMGKHDAVWVAEINRTVVGYCYVEIENGMQVIHAVYVHPKYHGKGIGSKLIAEAFRWFEQHKPVHLYVATYNGGAIRLYERLGFHRTRTKIQYPISPSRKPKTIPMILMTRNPKR